MPRPVAGNSTYVPALDGIRALAVVAVVGYHVGVPRMDGGLLGVGIFFTLSGFLITTLLLESWERTGTLELRTFWVRRARRLLPALIVLLATVLAVSALVDREVLAQRWREALGALFYVSNWQTISSEVSYFDRTGGPGPFDHLWSLAVEEQFYLIWPVLLAYLLWVTQGRLGRVARITLVLAGLSFVALAFLAQAGFDNTRAYEGTDTRAGGLLIGAALAMIWRPRHLPASLSRAGRLGLDATGLVALAVMALLVSRTTSYSLSLYYGGLLLLSVATALLVAVVVHPQSLVGRALGIAPLRWVGERSYGIYLWHMPVVVFTPAALLPRAPVVVATLQIALTTLLATVSWNRVEDPIRRLGFLTASGLRPRSRASQTPPGSPRRPRSAAEGALVAAVVGTTILSISAAIAGYRIPDSPLDGTSAGSSLSVSSSSASSSASASVKPSPSPSLSPSTSPSASPSPAASASAAAPAAVNPSASASPSPSPSPSPVGPPPPQTSCTSVVHIGDSTSIGLMDPVYQPVAAHRIDVRYHAVGVSDVTTDILGARSIVERYKGQPNAQEAVTARLNAGYDGCWVVALGINEVANQVVGGRVPLADRIDLIMTRLADQPSMWTTVRTIKGTGPYAAHNMDAWNEALKQACARYPSMRVYDWASEVDPAWYIPDQIHYSTSGYTQRADRIARALARAYPRDGAASGRCFVTSGL